MTISVVPTVDMLIPEPRIRLVVSSSTSSPNPVGSSALVTLNRLDPDGTTRKVIIDGGARLSGGSATQFDYHAPFNQTVYYSASAGGYTSAVVGIAQPSAVSWLAHPLNPSLSVQIDAVHRLGDLSQEGTAVLSYPFGSAVPISLSEGVRRSRTGQIVVNSNSPANLQALMTLLSDGGPVLMNLGGPDLGTLWRDETWAWIQPGGISVNNPVENISATFRRVTIPYTVIDTPAGAAIPIWTVAMVRAAYATVAAVRATYASVADLTTNTVGTPATGAIIPDPVNPGLFLPGGIVADSAHPGLYLIP